MKGLTNIQNYIIEQSGGEEITAYNYTNKEIKQGDWVHYNERVDNTSQIGNYDINGYANGYCVAPNIILYSSGAYNPNTIFTATLNESDNTYVASQVGSVSGYARRFCGIDKDGYLYSNTAFSSLNYEEGLYWGNDYNSAYSEYYLANGYLYKINKLTGSNISSFDNISYVMHDVYGGYSISDNILVVAKDGTLTKVILNFDNNTLSKTPTALSCGSIFGGMSNGIIFGQVSKPFDTVTSALLAFKYENGALITYSKENFPSAMQECFDNACNPFWDEQHGIFTAYIPSMSKLVCCQYVNNKWIDKSPILDVSNLSINTQSQFMVSSDFSRAFLKDTTQYGILQFSITSASDGNYLVPYFYTNSNSKMGKVKENVDAVIGTQCTVVIPKVQTSSVDPDPRPEEKGYLWTQDGAIVDTQFLDTHSEIYDSNKDSSPTNYVAVNYNIMGKPLIYRHSTGLVYGFDGLDDNFNLIWQQKFNWGQVSNLKTASYQDRIRNNKIVAINDGDSDTNIEWTILVQNIDGEVKKSKISRGLCFVTAGFTADGVPLLCACSESTLYHFLISTDEGDTWKEISIPVSDYEYIHNVLISKGSIFVVMGTYSDIILKSSDCGDTWERVNLGDYVGDNTSRAVIQDGYNGYILFPCSNYSEGYLWNGSEYKKVEIPGLIGMPNQTDFAISAPCVYGAIISRASKGLAFVVQLEDDYGIHIKKVFNYSAVNNAGVAPIIAKDREHLCSLNYSNKRFAILDYISRIAYTKKEIPEVGDQAATIDKQFDCTVTDYSNGVMKISIYQDSVPLIREPRGDGYLD